VSGRTPAPGLYRAKDWYTARLRFVVDAAVRRRLSPDLFTATGVGGGLVAAGLLAVSARHPHPLWSVAVAIALAVRLAGANLDGAVARARGLGRPWGFVLNEVGDRTSDLAPVLVLAACSGHPWGLAGLAGSFLPTCASLSVAAAGGPRLNGGPVGKTERCALLVMVALLAPWWPAYSLTSALIGVGGLVTAVVRLSAGARLLGGRGPQAHR